MSHCISLVFSASLSLFATQDYNIILYLELGIYSYSTVCIIENYTNWQEESLEQYLFRRDVIILNYIEFST